MLSRIALASVALAGALAFSAPAFAIEQIHLPDPSAAQNSGPPDALFDPSVPTTWQKKSSDEDQSGPGKFHFSMGSSSGAMGDSALSDGRSENNQTTSGYGMGANRSFGEDAKTPGSEFYQAAPYSPYLPY